MQGLSQVRLEINRKRGVALKSFLGSEHDQMYEPIFRYFRGSKDVPVWFYKFEPPPGASSFVWHTLVDAFSDNFNIINKNQTFLKQTPMIFTPLATTPLKRQNNGNNCLRENDYVGASPLR